MIVETKSKQMSIDEALRLRQQADELLHRLLNDREQSEKRFAEAGKRDPMKFITGRTALENAIASTREMISNMDALLAQMQGEIDGLPSLETSPRANGQRHHLENNGHAQPQIHIPTHRNGRMLANV